MRIDDGALLRSKSTCVNIVEKTDEEIKAIADHLWRDLVKNSNEGKYGDFVRNFSSSFALAMDQVQVGHQFANSELARNLSEDADYLGIIRRGEHVTVLYRQHREHVAALKSMTSRLLNCTERFSKGEYDKVRRELDSCMADRVFLDLPSEYRANILTIAGKCAYELEEWEALDEFVGLLETDYELENALPKILEA